MLPGQWVTEQYHHKDNRSLCHETMVRGWARLESSGIPGIERGIALSALMAFD